MAGVLFLSVLDVARALGPLPGQATPERVSEWLITEYLRKVAAGFNYNVSLRRGPPCEPRVDRAG
jgi:hypothetical protein